MINKTISHYKILSKIGQGGMGEVYLAEDTKLKRNVAIKFLPSHLTKDKESRERFEREAQAAASLNHPNIVTVFEIGEFEDQIYISMEYVEGETLREKMDSVGVKQSDNKFTLNEKIYLKNASPLQFNDIITIAIQICEGLEKAHQAEIVHRDIKPGNIIVDKDNRVKILDFGLAKLKGVSQLTQETSTIGTIHYMSPEQMRGDEVDSRSDIWSLGVMIYEMLTGQLPFKGEYDAQIIYSVINQEPISIKSIRNDVPNNLAQVINKCLEKNAQDRFGSVREIVVMLNEEDSEKSDVNIKESSHKEKSIIVLPFKNISPDSDQEYFSDGLTEEIITDLSHISELKVISRTSSMMLKGTKKDIRTISRELNIQFVLEGSVRKAGNNIRITAQLIDGINDSHIWAEKYNGNLDDVFDIQEKISNKIVSGLRVKLSLEEQEKLQSHLFQDARVMECWYRAKQEIHHYTEESLQRAIHIIQDGLKTVGEHPLLYWGLGYINWFFVNMGFRMDVKYLDLADNYVEYIFRLEPDSFLGYQLLGLTTYKRGDVRQSILNTEKAIEIDPNNPEALDHIIWMYAIVGKTELSYEYIERLLEIDPLTPHNYWVKGLTFQVEGRFKESLKYYKRAYELEPSNDVWRLFHYYALLFNYEYNKADKVVNRMENENLGSLITNMALLLKYCFAGNKEMVLKYYTEEMQKFGEWDEIISLLLSQSFAILDDKVKSFQWLEYSVSRGFINYPFLLKYDPFLKDIREDDRFKKLMDKVKYVWENQDNINYKKLLKIESTSASIIVLPFKNISPDPDQEYFSDGLTEEVITDLSQIQDLFVISRSSSMTFKESQKKITEIAKEVNVQYVLEGSVRKAGNNLRIAAQLIDASQDVHLWAEKYNGLLDDVFDIQEKVSRSIVEALKVKLSPQEEKQIAKREFVNVKSYECWLKARHEALQWTKTSLDQAMYHINKGLEIIGENSVLCAAKGFILIQFFNSGVKIDTNVFIEADVWFQKAFKLDQDVFLGHYGLGFLFFLQGNMKEAIVHLHKALKINPNNADVIRLLCYIYCIQIGKPNLAVALSQKAIEIDPLFPVNYIAPTFIPWAKGDLNLALMACSKYYEMAPENIHARFWYATYFAWNGLYQDTFSLINSNMSDYPEHTMTKFQVLFKHALKNEKKEIFESFSNDLKNYAWHHDTYTMIMAEVFSLINETSESLKWLTRLVDLGFINYPLLSKIDPFLENIRGDERFIKLMEWVKKEWEDFEV